jgi:hypothetical protein
MRSIVSHGVVAVALLLVVTGCAAAAESRPSSAPTTGPPASTTTTPPTPPAAAAIATGAEAQARLAALPMPSAAGPVLAVGTVLDAGTPMLCWQVLTSLPPQCSGPAIIGWDWSAVPHEEASGVRWADPVALEVTYDAAAFTITPTRPPLDRASLTLPDREIPVGDLGPATIAALQTDLVTIDRADVMGNGGEQGTMVLEVVYDDGSMQAALDAIYGAGVVHVEPWFIG